MSAKTKVQPGKQRVNYSTRNLDEDHLDRMRIIARYERRAVEAVLNEALEKALPAMLERAEREWRRRRRVAQEARDDTD